MEKLIKILPRLSLWGLLWGGIFGLISWIISSPLVYQLIDFKYGALIGQLFGALSVAAFCKILLKAKISSLTFALITAVVFVFVYESRLTIEVKQAIESFYSTKTDYNYALSYILCFGFITFSVGSVVEIYSNLGIYLAHIVKVPFGCQIIGRKLHIYENARGANNAGLPDNANIYIISKQSAATIADKLVELSDGIQSIEQLKFKITYEYHADSTYNPASLEFVIKDKAGNQIWRGTRDFLPPRRAAKRKQISKFSFDIGRRYEWQSVTIQVKPLKAGDFGFYIYDLDGTLVVKVK